MTRILLSTVFSLISFLSFAQSDLQKTFASAADKIEINTAAIDAVFAAQKSSAAIVRLSPEITFNGTVVANDVRYGNMQVIIIRSAEDEKVLLQVSKITAADDSISYFGKILNNGGNTAFEIKHNSGNYFLQKINMQRIIEPCNL